MIDIMMLGYSATPRTNRSSTRTNTTTWNRSRCLFWMSVRERGINQRQNRFRLLFLRDTFTWLDEEEDEPPPFPFKPPSLSNLAISFVRDLVAIAFSSRFQRFRRWTVRRHCSATILIHNKRSRYELYYGRRQMYGFFCLWWGRRDKRPLSQLALRFFCPSSSFFFYLLLWLIIIVFCWLSKNDVKTKKNWPSVHCCQKQKKWNFHPMRGVRS